MNKRLCDAKNVGCLLAVLLLVWWTHEVQAQQRSVTVKFALPKEAACQGVNCDRWNNNRYCRISGAKITQTNAIQAFMLCSIRTITFQ